MRDVVIIDSVRSAVGRRNGALSAMPATELLGDVLLGLLGSTSVLVLKDAERRPPRIRPALVEMLVQDAQRLRDKLIERSAAGLLDGGLAGPSAEYA